jgi:hypothetical protein
MYVDTIAQLGIVTVQPAAPANPASGDLWYDTVNGTFTIWDGVTWQSASVRFASAADAAAGTDVAGVINSAVLRGEISRSLGATIANLLAGTGSTASPDATPANDASRLVALDASGRIDPGFLSIRGMSFKGPIDATAAIPVPVLPATSFQSGDIFFNNKIGTIDPSWGAPAAGTASTAGDMIIYDGAKWTVVASESDLSQYVPLVGTNMAVGDATVITFAPATTDGSVVVLDLGNGALDNAWIDGGNY